jgi:hypothetical protein
MHYKEPEKVNKQEGHNELTYRNRLGPSGGGHVSYCPFCQLPAQSLQSC